MVANCKQTSRKFLFVYSSVVFFSDVFDNKK